MGRVSKLPAKDICKILYKKGIRFISGKWFCNNVEIRQINKYLYRVDEISFAINDVNDTRRVVDTFIEMYGEDGWWPTMPIIEEARLLIRPHKPCFPLSRKQLLLIKRLLLGDEEVMFILCGVGGSGKSTFANIVCQIFDNDVGILTLDDTTNDFKVAEVVNNRLIYADELNASELDNGKIKTMVSKQQMTINPKNETPYKARWQGSFLYSCNVEPKLDLKDSGLLRRIVYLFMNEKIKNPDKTMQKKIYDHDELVNIVRLALDEDDTDWYKEFKYETRMLLRQNNSVFQCMDEVAGVGGTPYETYKRNAMNKGLKPFSEPNFLQIREVLGQWEKEEKDDLPF